MLLTEVFLIGILVVLFPSCDSAAKEVDEKILKRQARFGIVAADDADAAKKKPAARSGGARASAPAAAAASSNPAMDEAKRKRAERFGLAVWSVYFVLQLPSEYFIQRTRWNDYSYCRQYRDESVWVHGVLHFEGRDDIVSIFLSLRYGFLLETY